MKLDIQEAGIGFFNAWGFAKSGAQIYNAVRKENFLDKEWQDMELALMFYGDAALFVGSRPDGVEEYFKRFCLSMGYSAQNFACGGARLHSRPIESRQGPRGVIDEKTVTPVAHELRFGYSSFDDSGKSAPNIERVLSSALKKMTSWLLLVPSNWLRFKNATRVKRNAKRTRHQRCSS